MARNFYRIFTENNPIMRDSKTFGIPEAKGLRCLKHLTSHDDRGLLISPLLSLPLTLSVSALSHSIALDEIEALAR